MRAGTTKMLTKNIDALAGRSEREKLQEAFDKPIHDPSGISPSDK